MIISATIARGGLLIVLAIASACTPAGHDPPTGRDGLHEDGAFQAEAGLYQQLSDCLEDAGHDGTLDSLHQRYRDDPGFASAVDDCADRLGVDLPNPDQFFARVDEHTLEMLDCLRDNGWSVPDAEPGENGMLVLVGSLAAGVPEGQLDEFSADLQRCTQG
jgi:hypothetical protein